MSSHMERSSSRDCDTNEEQETSSLEQLRLKRLAHLNQQETQESPSSREPSENEEIVRLKKMLEKIVVFDICDEKHKSPQMILEAISPLMKILINVRDYPREAKYRKLRYNNSIVHKYIIGTAAEKVMRIVGWTTIVENHERYLSFNHGEDTKEWSLLCMAIERLEKIQEKEAQREGAGGDAKVAEQKRLEKVLQDLREDEKERHARFRYE
eukprot:CAMPEP_0118801866 /NCGR_PEP_ID=MMETSP1161-20130426/3262_1 /TAXON_ID=249345 /ORGANISM="Picochlorum oklahomensis, Strain CCMP2329" /LENGTH=210 /DNA_ID=CAMNT_0006729845 /DNA_START=15 /DNA_END=647 /DNA_ORIENTATION=-